MFSHINKERVFYALYLLMLVAGTALWFTICILLYANYLSLLDTGNYKLNQLACMLYILFSIGTAGIAVYNLGVAYDIPKDCQRYY